MQQSTAKVGQLEADDAMVSFKGYLPEPLHQPGFDPLSSRLRRSVLSEQDSSAILQYAHPNTKTWMSFPKITLSGMRGRWQPKGWFVVRSGKRASNCSQTGSMMYG